MPDILTKLNREEIKIMAKLCNSERQLWLMAVYVVGVLARQSEPEIMQACTDFITKMHGLTDGYVPLPPTESIQ